MKCTMCGAQTRFDLLFMGFLDYRLGYVILECRSCHKAAYSLNMSNLSEIGEYLLGDFRLCELHDSTLGALLYNESLDAETKRFAIKETLLRKAKQRVVKMSNHDELKGQKINLESLLENKRRSGRFTNGAL